jgi:hypothetical protein
MVIKITFDRGVGRRPKTLRKSDVNALDACPSVRTVGRSSRAITLGCSLPTTSKTHGSVPAVRTSSGTERTSGTPVPPETPDRCRRATRRRVEGAGFEPREAIADRTVDYPVTRPSPRPGVAGTEWVQRSCSTTEPPFHRTYADETLLHTGRCGAATGSRCGRRSHGRRVPRHRRRP